MDRDPAVQDTPVNLASRYGRVDRWLHRVALSSGVTQLVLSDLEDALLGKVYRSIPIDRPVFVTALPRSGTTILLNLLHGTGRFASHSYRDMPFVTAPLLWSRFSRRFAIDESPRERAHADGLTISPDSPEAFEEIIWKRFYRSHYRSDRIPPWTEADRDEEFETFLQNNMRKVIAVRSAGHKQGMRYLSKNNLNIARLAAPPRAMRGGIVLIPFRDPFQTAESLRRQHRRFIKLQAEDAFAEWYMNHVGHHEFGRGLKLVNFGGWMSSGGADPDTLDFWIRYWVAAYAFILEHRQPNVHLISYERLIAAPQTALSEIAELVGVASAELSLLAPLVREPREHGVEASDRLGEIAERAIEVYDHLREVASI